MLSTWKQWLFPSAWRVDDLAPSVPQVAWLWPDLPVSFDDSVPLGDGNASRFFKFPSLRPTSQGRALRGPWATRPLVTSLGGRIERSKVKVAFLGDPDCVFGR